MAARVAVKALALSGLGATLIGCGGDTTAAPTEAPKPTEAPGPAPAPVWPNTVELVWQNHFDAFGAGNVSMIMADYDNDSVLAIFNDKCAGSSGGGDPVPGYTEYKGTKQIEDFFTALFTRLKESDPAGKPTQNISKLGPLSENGPASVQVGSDIAANSVFLTWRTDGLPKPIDLATDTFTFKKDGDAYRILKQNIVASEPDEACSDGTAYNATALKECDLSNKICAGWGNHFKAFGEQNSTLIMDDYTDDSLVQVYDNELGNGTYTKFKGKGPIKTMFEDLFAALGEGNPGLAVKVLDVDVTKKTVFLVWTSDSHPKATDTFIFDSEGKILTQTIVVSTKAGLAAEMMI